MAYTPNTWVNGTTPALNATNLNKMETGIDDAHDAIVALNAALVTNLIAGATPTFSGWDADPTDAADITDGDIATICTTGSVAAAAWAYAYIEYDLGSFYDVICTLFGNVAVTAGTGYLNVEHFDGSNWFAPSTVASLGNSAHAGIVSGSKCSKVRLTLTSSNISTNTPNIREFSVWRL